MNKLKEYRVSRNISQQALADLAQCSRSYVSEVENGRAVLTLKMANRFSQFLHVDPYELLGSDAIKYMGDFEQTLKALVESHFDIIVESTQDGDLPESTWDLYSILFDIFNLKFTLADIKVIRAVVDSIKLKYEDKK